MKRIIFPLLSGGMDSTIAILKRFEIKDFTGVQPIFIDYGQKACENEWTAVTKITKMIKEKFQDDKIKFFEPKRIDLHCSCKGADPVFHWSKSQLFSGDRDGCPYVENRNMILLSISASFIETKIRRLDEGEIITGFRNEYADTKQEFTDSMNKVFSLVYSKLKKTIWINNPVVNYGKNGKQDMFDEFQEHLDIIKLTWSCYIPKNGKPCGTCKACLNRPDITI